MGTQVERVSRHAPQVGHAREIRSLSCRKLNRQVFVDGFERNLVQNDLNVFVLLLEAAQEVRHDLAFIAVRVPGHSKRGLRLSVAEKARREHEAAQEHRRSFHRFLPFLSLRKQTYSRSIAPQGSTQTSSWKGTGRSSRFGRDLCNRPLSQGFVHWLGCRSKQDYSDAKWNNGCI